MCTDTTIIRAPVVQAMLCVRNPVVAVRGVTVRGVTVRVVTVRVVTVRVVRGWPVATAASTPVHKTASIVFSAAT